MMFGGHRPIFGCIDHRLSPTQAPFARTAPERTAWDAQRGPIKEVWEWKPERSALAFRGGQSAPSRQQSRETVFRAGHIGRAVTRADGRIWPIRQPQPSREITAVWVAG